MLKKFLYTIITLISVPLYSMETSNDPKKLDYDLIKSSKPFLKIETNMNLSIENIEILNESFILPDAYSALSQNEITVVDDLGASRYSLDTGKKISSPKKRKPHVLYNINNKGTVAVIGCTTKLHNKILDLQTNTYKPINLNGNITAIKFCPSDQYVAITDHSGWSKGNGFTTKLYDLTTNKQLFKKDSYNQPGFAFQKDTLFSINEDTKLLEIKELPNLTLKASKENVEGDQIAISPKGICIATASRKTLSGDKNSIITIFDYNDKNITLKKFFDVRSVFCLNFLNEHTILYSDWNGSIHYLDINTGNDCAFSAALDPHECATHIAINDTSIATETDKEIKVFPRYDTLSLKQKAFLLQINKLKSMAYKTKLEKEAFEQKQAALLKNSILQNFAPELFKEYIIKTIKGCAKPYIVKK